MLLLLVLACGFAVSPTDTDTPTDTADTDTGDTDTGADTGPTDTCALLDPGERLVLDEPACVDGICAPADYLDVVAAWGAEEACLVVGTTAWCEWGDVAVTFPDCDDDGRPDEEYLCDMFDQEIVIDGGWDGASAEGLGLGVSAECWEEVLGEPGSRGWEFGFNPVVHVTVLPTDGAVDRISISWSWDE